MNSHKKDKLTRRYRYNEDRDTLKRGIGVMADLLQWVVWLLVVIAALLFAGLLGVSFYLFVSRMSP